MLACTVGLMTGHARVGALAMLVGFNSDSQATFHRIGSPPVGALATATCHHAREGSPRTLVDSKLQWIFRPVNKQFPLGEYREPACSLLPRITRCAILRFHMTRLLLARSHAEGRVIPLREVSQATGISISVLSSLASERPGITTNTRFVEALCRYFRCAPGELLELSPALADEQRCHVDELYPTRGAHRANPETT